MKRFVLPCLAIVSTCFFAFITVLFALPSPNHPFGLRSVAGIVMGIGLVWACISTWVRVYVYEKAGLSSEMKLFPGSLPKDPIELRVWIWKWHFYAALLLILLCAIVISSSVWLQGD